MVPKKHGWVIIAIGLVLITIGAAWLRVRKLSYYPLRTDVTLKYWMELNINTASVYQNFGDTVLAKELAKRTGVKCEYLHPADAGDRAKEAFTLMLASGDLPDVVEYQWANIPGGPNAALNNGYILKLNKVFDRYAPNLKAWLGKHPQWDRQIKTDEGDYYVFPFIRDDDRLLVTSGPIIRKDWLDELHLAVPETPEEWHEVLKAFREKKGATAPLAMTLTQLQTDVGSGFDFCGDEQGFYVEQGTVGFGLNTPQYKQFLMTMRQWFAEGLIDSNFANLSNKTRDANMINGKSGIVDGSAGSGIGVWMAAMAKRDPRFSVIGFKFATSQKGKRSRFARRSSGYGGTNVGNAAISARCQSVEAAARMLDYNYSTAGSLLNNFGIEGVSFQMVNHYPTYTRLVRENKQLPFASALAKYARANANGPFIQDARYIDQYYILPQQIASRKNWMNNDYARYFLPPVTPNDQESLQLARIMNNVDTYMDEMSLKFIMGVEPISRYDEYLASLDKLGIREAIRIYQTAYNRYLGR